MSDDPNPEEISRRKVVRNLIGASTLGGAVIAGHQYQQNTDNTASNTSKNSDPTPKYQAAIGFKENGTDLTDKDQFEIGIDIQRTLDGETETLPQENISNITGYTVRKHPDYSEELLQQAGLSTEVELEHTEGNIYTTTKDEVLAGNTTLNLEITAEDPEYGRKITRSLEKELQIHKTPEETLKDTWTEDQELYDQLRNTYLEKRLGKGVGGKYDTWGELGEAAMRTAHEEWDADTEEDWEEKLKFHAGEWISHAGNAIGGTGQPSGQANFEAFTLEQHFDNVTAGQMNNNGHNTVLLHHHGQDKTYHVESNGGLSHYPPKEAGWPYSHKNDTPLWKTENNLPRAKSTLLELSAINDEDWRDKNRLEDQYVIDAMTQLRNGDGGNVINTMQNLYLSLELNPSTEYQLKGIPNDPSVVVQ